MLMLWLSLEENLFSQLTCIKRSASVRSQAAAKEKNRRGNVAYVGMDGRVQASVPKWCADDPAHSACKDDDGGAESQVLPWGVDRIDAEKNTNTGAGVHLYLVDTGIDLDHPDLQANMGNSVDCTDHTGGPPGSRTYTCVSGGDDDNGHGTHVAGTVGALDNKIDVVGVAPDVTLHAVKVLDSRGSGSFSAIIAGIDWIAGQVSGAPVVTNMSLGGSGSKTGTCSSGGFSGSDALHEAMCNATNTGVVFAVAAGNDDADAQDSVPAPYDDVSMAISATGDQQELIISNRRTERQPGPFNQER